MKDKFNLPKGDVMKTIFATLLVSIFIFTGCSQKEVSPMIDDNQSKVDPNKKYAYVDHQDFIAELPLHDAVRAKDITQVKLLVENSSSINTKDIYGYSPLHIAVRLHDLNVTKYLIEKKADVNNIDIYGDTPLLDSTRDGDTEISKELICNGADRRVQDRYKMTPLHYSVKNKDQLITEMLLARDLSLYCGGMVKEPEPVMEEPQVEEPVVEETPMLEEPIIEEPMIEEAPMEEMPLSEVPEFKGLYEALNEEFQDDFEPWNAELTRDDLLFRFNNPVTLFERGKANLKPGFANILNDFFPRYLKVLSEYKDNIEEVRVEGHTSSEYSSARDDAERYRLNKVLSQKRANSVRDYSIEGVVFEQGSSELRPIVPSEVIDNGVDGFWVNDVFQPYGMSYDNLIFNPDGSENQEASRRVEFKIIRK